MKFLRNVLLWAAGIVIVLAVAGLGSAQFTRNQTGEIPAALDNINPLVKTETVYMATNVEPVKHFKGGGGEDEYTYVVTTVNADGKTRKLEFNAQWRLKAHKYLAITTKGQNVEHWTAAAASAVPTKVKAMLD